MGGEPTRPLPRADEGKQTTPARVVGVGRAYSGWLEIDAYGWRPPPDSSGERQQFCTWIEFENELLATFGSCLGSAEIEQPLAIESVSQLVLPRRLRSTRIGGALSPDVARVELSVKRPGAKAMQRVRATVARVDGQLMRQLQQRTPFGYFFAKVRGGVRSKDISATAYDASGRKLGSTRGLKAQQP